MLSVIWVSVVSRLIEAWRTLFSLGVGKICWEKVAYLPEVAGLAMCSLAAFSPPFTSYEAPLKGG
jgi:hypothetical protein